MMAGCNALMIENADQRLSDHETVHVRDNYQLGCLCTIPCSDSGTLHRRRTIICRNVGTCYLWSTFGHDLNKAYMLKRTKSHAHFTCTPDVRLQLVSTDPTKIQNLGGDEVCRRHPVCSRRGLQAVTKWETKLTVQSSAPGLLGWGPYCLLLRSVPGRGECVC